MNFLLKKLTLQNFQGGNFSLEAKSGEDLNIYGANGSGKTRLMSAFLWLLTGKDSLGRSDFEIKNLDKSGNQEHGLDHIVEAVLEINGNDLELKKIYREVWQKKRGGAERVFSGHTIDHFIDKVPVKESEYRTKIAEIFGDETRFQLLTNPAAFAAMPWQKQRALLMEICGDIPDTEIIESDETLSPLLEAIARYTTVGVRMTSGKSPLDNLKKIAQGRKAEILKQIDQIPIRIDEIERGLPEITGLDKKALKTEISFLEGELNSAKLRLAGIDTGGKIAPLTKELNTLNAEISRMENAHYLEQSKIVTKLTQQIRTLIDADESAIRKAKSIAAEIEEKKSRIVALDKKLDAVREKWYKINEEKFQDTTELICPACGQNLPADKVESAREKAIAEFNASKADRLSQAQTEGKRMTTEKERLVNELKELQEIVIQSSDNKAEIERLTQERDAAKVYAEDYSVIDGRAAIKKRIAELLDQIEEARIGISQYRDAIQKEIDGLTKQLSEIKGKADLFAYREQGEKRIKELKGEEKTLAREFEETERLLFLVEAFTKKKVSLLTDRINEKFFMVRFKLFNQLVNGGIEETCEMTVGGVPYNGGLNAAARTQGGMDIISALQKHYGIAPTVFIDNRESVTEIPAMDCQIINLFVSAEDKTLRVEAA